MIKENLRRLIFFNPTVESFIRKNILVYIRNQELEQKLIKELPKNYFNLCIDIGAGVGEYTTLLAKKSKLTIAFEPLGENLKILKHFENVKIKIEGTALSDRDGYSELLLTNIDTFHSTLSTTNQTTIKYFSGRKEIKTQKLDTYISLMDNNNIDFIKIDVEGHEFAVLKGAEHILQTMHPILLIEMEHRHGTKIQEIFEYLENMQYQGYYTLDGRIYDYINFTKYLELWGSSNNDSKPPVNNFLFIEKKSHFITEIYSRTKKIEFVVK